MYDIAQTSPRTSVRSPLLLWEREQRFIELCVAGSLPSKAAREAGFPVASADVRASELMRQPRIQAAIAEGLERRGLDDKSLVAAVWVNFHLAIRASNTKKLLRLLNLADSVGTRLSVKKREQLARRIWR